MGFFYADHQGSRALSLSSLFCEQKMAQRHSHRMPTRDHMPLIISRRNLPWNEHPVFFSFAVLSRKHDRVNFLDILCLSRQDFIYCECSSRWVSCCIRCMPRHVHSDISSFAQRREKVSTWWSDCRCVRSPPWSLIVSSETSLDSTFHCRAHRVHAFDPMWFHFAFIIREGDENYLPILFGIQIAVTLSLSVDLLNSSLRNDQKDEQ